MSYANNKDADEPVHPRSLIISFVVRFLDNMIPMMLYVKFQDAM